jgi:hypothetical protein
VPRGGVLRRQAPLPASGVDLMNLRSRGGNSSLKRITPDDRKELVPELRVTIKQSWLSKHESDLVCLAQALQSGRQWPERPLRERCSSTDLSPYKKTQATCLLHQVPVPAPLIRLDAESAVDTF